MDNKVIDKFVDDLVDFVESKGIPTEYVKTREDAIKPTRGSAAAAGYDLYIPSSEEKIEIPAHSTVKIDIGIAIALPDNTFGAIFARSGLATKQGLRPANAVGVVDSDYRRKYYSSTSQ